MRILVTSCCFCCVLLILFWIFCWVYVFQLFSLVLFYRFVFSVVFRISFFGILLWAFQITPGDDCALGHEVTIILPIQGLHQDMSCSRTTNADFPLESLVQSPEVQMKSQWFQCLLVSLLCWSNQAFLDEISTPFRLTVLTPPNSKRKSTQEKVNLVNHHFFPLFFLFFFPLACDFPRFSPLWHIAISTAETSICSCSATSKSFSSSVSSSSPAIDTMGTMASQGVAMLSCGKVEVVGTNWEQPGKKLRTAIACSGGVAKVADLASYRYLKYPKIPTLQYSAPSAGSNLHFQP